MSSKAVKETTSIQCNSGCICIPTEAKDTINVCLDGKNNIVKCNTCTKCTTFTTNGAKTLCVRREGGLIKKCDSCCTDTGCSCTSDDGKGEVKTCNDCECNSKSGCDKHGCLCITIEGGKCICICKDETGGLKKCEDCKCSSKVSTKVACCTDEGGINKCKDCECNSKSGCDKHGCFCITIEGGKCICICKDKTGGLKKCEDCKWSSKASTKVACCTDEGGINKCKDCECKSKSGCDNDGCFCITIEDGKCICICEDGTGGLKKCEDCKCSSKESTKYGCCTNKGCICACDDGKREVKKCQDCKCFLDGKNKDCYCIATAEGCICIFFDQEGIKKCTNCCNTK
ncbi:keratin-associated protein 5-3-like isoform X2 [Pieris brassicae]|uniref:keratin-associated protein 5-3-like isoform X2 n=1 Tax=Pieris brassicae TaxID=7116 RepID=UPI001E65EBDA|nr:keratin-associated protein 5-3-like isoform X2 [Pieris brassicae]